MSWVDNLDRHPTPERLKAPRVSGSVKVGDHGAPVIWANDDTLALAADNLRVRDVEQAGGASHEFIWNWMTRQDLILDTVAVAVAVGVSRRTLAYYRTGSDRVPRTVALTCLGSQKLRENERSDA